MLLSIANFKIKLPILAPIVLYKSRVSFDASYGFVAKKAAVKKGAFRAGAAMPMAFGGKPWAVDCGDGHGHLGDFSTEGAANGCRDQHVKDFPTHDVEVTGPQGDQ